MRHPQVDAGEAIIGVWLGLLGGASLADHNSLGGLATLTALYTLCLAILDRNRIEAVQEALQLVRRANAALSRNLERIYPV